MKNQIDPIEKQAQKIAFSFIYSTANVWCGKSPKLDQRFNVNKLALSIIRKNNITYAEKIRIKEVQRKRRILQNGEKKGSILANPIVRDYLSNKGYLKSVENDHLSFIGYRNHWAKNETDLKILAVLKKHFIASKK